MGRDASLQVRPRDTLELQLISRLLRSVPLEKMGFGGWTLCRCTPELPKFLSKSPKVSSLDLAALPSITHWWQGRAGNPNCGLG